MNITIQLTPEQILQLSTSAQSISVEDYGPDIAMHLLTEQGENEEIQAAIAHYTKVKDAKGTGYTHENTQFVYVDNHRHGHRWLDDYEIQEKVRKSYMTLRRYLLTQISASMRKELEEETKKYQGEFLEAVLAEFRSQSKSIMNSFIAASFTQLFNNNQHQVVSAIREGLHSETK